MDGMGIGGSAEQAPLGSRVSTSWCSDPRPYLWPIKAVKAMVPPWGGMPFWDDMLERWGDGVEKIGQGRWFGGIQYSILSNPTLDLL